MIDYLNIITSQHATKPKYTEFVSIFLEKIQDVNAVLGSFETVFSLPLADGKQLDIIGNLLNAKRTLPFAVDGVTTLTDEDYLTLLYSRIGRNNWDGSIFEIHELWKSMFPTNPILVRDNQNMTAEIVMSGEISDIELALLINGFLVAKTAAVGMTFALAPDSLFAYDKEVASGAGSYFAGYDVGYWEEIL